MCMKKYKQQAKAGYLLLEAMVGLAILASFTLMFLGGVKQQLKEIDAARQAVRQSRALFEGVTAARAGIIQEGCTVDFTTGEVVFEVDDNHEKNIFLQAE